MLTDSQRAALTARLRRGREPDSSAAMRRRDPGLAELPLSFGQEQLWFIDRFAPGQAMYNIPLAISVRGLADAAALSRAVSGVVARHEALRTRLVADRGGRPVQIVDPPEPVPVALADLSGIGTGQQARLREFIDAAAVQPFDLATGPLLRCTLIRLAVQDQVLLIILHHAVFDGWSAGVLVREIAALYRHEAAGEPSGLAELPVQFADYALWERERGEVQTELGQYWRQVLDGFETVQFPADRPRPVVEDWAGGLAVVTTEPGLLAELRELSRAHGTTLFVTLMTALHALLHRYTGQTDLVVGTVSANRGRPELAPIIGFLVNTLPVRADLAGDPSFAELLGQVKQVTTGGYAHQDLPFGRMVDLLKVQRDPGRAPVFQIALAFSERDLEPIEAAGVRFALTDLVAGIHSAKFDLSFTAEARAGGLWIECSYKTALFDHRTVQRLLEHLEVLLRGAVAKPSARLSELPVLTLAELHSELAEWNDTARAYPQVCLHEGFEAQVRRTPLAVAAEFEHDQISYTRLNERADRIARLLREHGTGPEALVGICMQPGITRLAALLGVLKAGGGYVPLDPSLPGERLAYMIADTGMAVLLADKLSAAELPPDTGAVILTLPDAEQDVADPPDGASLAATGVTPSNVAYVIYTSGSTGQPKGVVIEHRQAVNFVYAMIEPWQVGPADTVLQFAAYTFDVSVLDMFVPLLAGGKVVLGQADTLHTPRRLAALIRDSGVTFTCLPPAVLGLLTGESFPELRVLLVAGEELPSGLAAAWVRPGLTFVNAYGPTETAVIATYGQVGPGTLLPPPIGLPAANYQAYVLDDHLNPVPAGATGELHIGGAGVARGYLHRPELTASQFIPDPFTPGGRLYKTGDLCRRRPDGAIVYLGRTDHQVKLHGLRIELGEIETALATHPAIAQAITVLSTDPAGDKQLTAYLRPAAGHAPPGPAELRRHLSTVLPGYMIPWNYVTVDEFPLNTSGKINRSALPPAHAPAQAAAPAEPPATSTEATLTELFATILHRDHVSPTDNFFDIGGNSLQVMQLLNLITSRTYNDLSPATVFLHPTPRQLATQLDTAAEADAISSPLIRLSPATTRPPLIFIHAIGGTVFDYTALATGISGAFSAHGLQAPGLTAPGTTSASLTDLVRDYTKVISEAYHHGPYYLAGWSMGGVIAYEVTRLLEAQGREVALLVLLDPPYAVPPAGQLNQAQIARQFVADAISGLGRPATTLPDPATTTAAAQLDWLAGQLSDRSSAPAGADDPMTAELHRRLEVFTAHTSLLAGYQPAVASSVSAPTLLVTASRSLNGPDSARWYRHLAGPAVTLFLDSDHYEFLRPPLVTEVATTIATWPSH